MPTLTRRRARSPPAARPEPPAFVTLREQVGPVAGIGARTLHMHSDLIDWLCDPRTPRNRVNRANLVLRHLAAFGRSGVVKLVSGRARGWRRSPLGGGHGMHYYLWWAAQGTPPVADLALDKNDILLRVVRHHDDTGKPLSVGVWPDDYDTLDLSDLVNDREDYGFAYHDRQRSISESPAPVRFIKGHPGSGKTHSLWLSASLLDGKKALYLTYSERLAVEAEQYFLALGPASLSVQTTSFGEFLETLAGEPVVIGTARPASLRQPQAARFAGFRELIGAGYRGRLGPWADRLEALYSEIHAHLLGRALPIAFLNVPAADGLLMSDKAYRKLRRRVLGDEATTSALSVAHFVADQGRLGALFPGPVRARHALERLTDARAVGRFVDLDGIFIDEIQDLTLVESYLLMRVCALVGALPDRRQPAFIAAGDEGQTVRPTDFDWGELANLASANIGKRSEWELVSNVRSPRKIALVVNQSWELYRSLSRRERPRGYAHAEVDEATQGSVIYTQCRDMSEFVEFVKRYEELPNSVLIYPDHSVPADYLKVPELADAIMTSRITKGLGFQTVGVLQPAAHIARVDELARTGDRHGRLHELWGRALVDQFRVAISRATEHLLLIDIGPDPGIGPDDDARALVLELCADSAPMDMEPDQVIDFLQRGDRDATDLVAEFAEEVDTLLGNQPVRAYRRASHMVALLGERESPTAVHDAALRARAWHLLGRAVIDLLRDWRDLAPNLDLRSVHDAGTEAFDIVDQPEHTAAVKFLYQVTAIEDARDWHFLSPEAERMMILLPRLESGIARAVRQSLRRWCRHAATAPVSPTALVRADLRAAFARAVELFAETDPGVVAEYEQAKENSARKALEHEHFAEALDVLTTLATRQHALEAACHVGLGEHALAAASYERAGEHGAAIECLRQIADVDGSLRIARVRESPEPDHLVLAGALPGAYRRTHAGAVRVADQSRAELAQARHPQALREARSRRQERIDPAFARQVVSGQRDANPSAGRSAPVSADKSVGRSISRARLGDRCTCTARSIRRPRSRCLARLSAWPKQVASRSGGASARALVPSSRRSGTTTMACSRTSATRSATSAGVRSGRSAMSTTAARAPWRPRCASPASTTRPRWPS